MWLIVLEVRCRCCIVNALVAIEARLHSTLPYESRIHGTRMRCNERRTQNAEGTAERIIGMAQRFQITTCLVDVQEVGRI